MSTRHIPSQIGDLPPIGRPAGSALLEIGVTTLAQVAELGERDLLGLHGVGPKAVRILREALEAEGLSLRE
jgi:predicted flap endonuclease-1-like 5' DNA nuclease